MLRRIGAMVMRHLYMFPRTLERWAESIYWPVLDLVLWGLTTRWVESSQGDVPHLALIMLTGVVFWQVVWRANYEISVNLLEEFWNQNLVNLFSTPLNVWEWSVEPDRPWAAEERADAGGRRGRRLAALPPQRLRRRLDDAAVPVLAPDVGLVHGIHGLGRDHLLRPGLQSLAWMAGFALAPFSAVFYPVEVLPRWAQYVSAALPMTYIFEGMRQILRGGQPPISNLRSASA